jgi:hypothetical protein
MRIILIVLTLLMASACGKSDPAATVSNLSGTYKGPETGTQAGTPFTTEATAIITQSGSSITGTLTNTAGASGTLTGTLNGETIENLVFTQSAPCSGTISGSGTIRNNVVTGTGSGTLAVCGAVNVTLTLTKQ